VLRDVLGMTGTKFGCGMARRVHRAYRRHPFLHHLYRQHRRLPDHNDRGNRRDPCERQDLEGWLDREVVQCGYCQSGQIMSASALLASNPHPTDADIDDVTSPGAAFSSWSGRGRRPGAEPELAVRKR
jgi:isoquinoline 1-oxidoreductase alpha subunit